jgi:hypothetical protein
MRTLYVSLAAVLFVFTNSISFAQQSRQDPAFTSPGSGWQLVGDLEGAVIWVHPTSRQRQGNSVQIWEMQNSKIGHAVCLPGWPCSMSSRTLLEFNCRERTVRQLSTSTHTSVNASGRTIDREDAARGWRHIPPGTIVQDMMRIACSN